MKVTKKIQVDRHPPVNHETTFTWPTDGFLQMKENSPRLVINRWQATAAHTRQVLKVTRNKELKKTKRKKVIIVEVLYLSVPPKWFVCWFDRNISGLSDLTRLLCHADGRPSVGSCHVQTWHLYDSIIKYYSSVTKARNYLRGYGPVNPALTARSSTGCRSIYCLLPARLTIFFLFGRGGESAPSASLV